MQDVWETGILGEFFNKGFVCLCSKIRDLREVEKWCSIILFIFLYKFVVKVLVIRIRFFMDVWVKSEQRGLISGRIIANNFLLFREVRWYAYVFSRRLFFYSWIIRRFMIGSMVFFI